jgi:hypothetical protein
MPRNLRTAFKFLGGGNPRIASVLSGKISIPSADKEFNLRFYRLHPIPVQGKTSLLQTAKDLLKMGQVVFHSARVHEQVIHKVINVTVFEIAK